MLLNKREKEYRQIQLSMKERDYFIMDIEKPMYERYDKAVERNDKEELEWFAQFGSSKWESQMITNARCYEQYLKCGYKGMPRFDEHGWLRNGHCTELKEMAETIEVFKDGQFHAVVMVVQHPNGTWTASTEYALSQSGGGAYPSIWGTTYSSRREALNVSLDKILSCIENSKVKNDKRYLDAVRKMRGETRQLSLFDFV